MAARAHDIVALAIKGNSVFLNFPKLVYELPHPASLSHKDIHVAAAKAAATTFDKQPASCKVETEDQGKQSQLEFPISHSPILTITSDDTEENSHQCFHPQTKKHCSTCLI
uniref:Uncharacterized protein n=1 Tax=Nelumbo nucifera TaxID=4432 RepID=A0A822YJH5_NELNU|nr:TPA_asm: hypothetical protein HUJ06_011493 [Nelumbo nucifera]